MSLLPVLVPSPPDEEKAAGKGEVRFTIDKSREVLIWDEQASGGEVLKHLRLLKLSDQPRSRPKILRDQSEYMQQVPSILRPTGVRSGYGKVNNNINTCVTCPNRFGG